MIYRCDRTAAQLFDDFPARWLISAMYLGTQTICIGGRKSFLDRLDRFLASEGAVPVEVFRETVGTVEVIVWELQLKDGVIFMEHDPYLGRSITGPHHLVDRVAKIAFGIPQD